MREGVGRRPFLLIFLLSLIVTLSCRAMTGSPPELSGLDSPSPTALASPNLPTQTSSPVPPERSFRIVGYYASWSIYARGYSVTAVPADRLTHINYAFANIDENGECVSGDVQADETNIPELRRIKEQNSGLRILISIGGRGTAPMFSKAVADSASRGRFVDSCVTFMKANGFDGMDIDWEYPEPAESDNFLSLLAELRARMDELSAQDVTARNGEPYLLTIAYGASPYQVDDIDLGKASNLVDWINLMAYGFHGPWSDLTGFNAPLYASPRDQAESEVERLKFNLEAAVQAYLARQVPSDKIVAGIPFFGYGWGGVADVNQGLYQPFDPAPEHTRSYDYREIREVMLAEGSSFALYWDEAAKAPWLYSPVESVMISYDDPQSVGLKAAYARGRGLGGVMLWHLAADDREHSLLQAVYNFSR